MKVHIVLAALLCALVTSTSLLAQHTPERVLYRRTSDIPGNDFGGALPGNVDLELPFGEFDDGSSLVTNINIDREGSVGEGISLAGDNFDLVFVMQFYDADGVFSFTENFDDRVKVVATPIAGSADLTETGASQEHSNTSWNTRTYGNYDFGAGGWFNANIWLTEDGGGAQSAADIGFGYFNGTSTNTADFGGIGYAGTFGVSSGVPAAFDTDDNGESWGVYVNVADLSIDADGDSIPDAVEEVYFPGDLTQLGAGDFDDDGVNDPDEYVDGTDPTVADADNDGSNDGQEKAAGTDPANPDSDGDGLLDGVETGTGTLVSADDTGTNPLAADTDGDGLSDAAEIADENYDPNVDDSASDVDADGVTLSEELAAGTDPADDDSDDDTLLDGAELTAGTNPLSGDTDGDGLGDAVETGTGTLVDANDTGTDPTLADTDGDGASDSYEIDQGFDPNDADSTPPIPVVQPSFIPINEFVPGGYAPDLTQTGLNYQQNKYNGGVIFNNQAEGNYNAHVSGNPTPNSSFDAIVPWASHGNGGGQISNRNSAFVDGGGENFTVRINGYLDMSSFAPGTYNIHLGGDDTNYFIMDTVDGQVTAQHNCCPQNQTTAFTITIPGIFPFDNVFGEQGGGDWYDVGISGPGIDGIVALGDTERGSPPVNPIGIDTTDSDADGLIDAWELSNTGIDDLTALSSDGDFDSDGSTDLAEYTAGTDPTDDDSDDDGLLDGAEATAGTDPTLADTDGDGLSDGQESTAGTDPTLADTDGDGLGDAQELAFGSDPLDAASLPVAPVVQPSFVPINELEAGVYGPDLATPGVDYQENKYPGGVIANGQSLNNYNVHLSGSPAPNSSVTAVQPWTSHGGGGNFSTRNSPFVDGGGDNFTVRYNGYLDMRLYAAGDYTIHIQSDDTNYFVMDTVDGTVIADDPNCCAERTQAFTITIPGLFPFDNVFGEQGGGEWTDVAISGPGIPGIVALGDTENGSPPVYVIGGEQLDTDGDGLLDVEEAALGTDPTLVDTDGDSLSDGVEVSGGTSPVLADTDGDGFSDANEVAAGSDPNNANSPTPQLAQHTPERVLYRRTSDIPGNDFGGALPGNVDIEAPFGELDDGSSLVTNINIDREGSVGEGISLAGDNFDLVFVMQFYDADGVFSFTENFDDRVKVVATPIAGSADLTATGASQEHSNTSWNTRTYGNYDFGAGGWFNANIWLTEDGGGAQSAADIGFGYFNGTSTNTADFGGIGYAGTFGVSSGAPAAFDTDDNGESWGVYVNVADLSIDTDGDSIPDAVEEVYFPGDLTQLGAGDLDDDGVSDVDEYADGTDPTDPDADEDGSNDGQEKAVGTDPANPDSDGDGLLDGVETGTGTFVDANDTGTSPLLADTDSDGLSDGAEIADENYDPNVDDSASDVDADGVSLSEELAAGTDPADDDSDDDTLLDGAELTAGTNPLSNDTDGDGLGDGVETGTGTFVDANDTGTDPLLADTDGDGSDDSYEIDQGFDPNDADSTPPIPVVQPSFIPINEFVPGGYAPDLTQTGLNYQQNKYNGGVIFNNQAEGNYNAHVSGNPTPNSSFDAIVPWASHGNGGGQISDRNSAFVDGGGENFTVRINGYLDMSSFAPGTYNIHLGGDDTNYFIMDTVDGQVTAQHNCCPQNQTTAFTITIPGIFPFDNVFGEQGGGDWYDVGISGPGINGIVALGDTERGSPPVNPIGIATTDSDADGLIDAWELSNTGIDDLTALAGTLANSVTGFSNVQGQDGWQHGYRNFTLDGGGTDYEPGDFIQFPEDAWREAQSQWRLAPSAAPWTTLAAENTHPNGTNSAPNEEHWTVRRWTADADENVVINWTTRKVNPNNDGVTGAVHVNGVRVDSATIAGNDTTGVSRTLAASISAGDVIDLVLTPQGLTSNIDGSDGSANSMTIEGDFDGDGSSDLAEYTAGTDPTDSDSDDDGLSDGAEVAAGTDPANADSDGDGLSDGQESTAGTDPTLADTDGDGLGDGQELSFGSDPLDAASLPVDPIVQPSFVPINELEAGVYGPDFATPGVDYQENKYGGGVIANGQSLNNYNVHLSGSPAPNSSVTAVQPWTSHGGGGNFSTRNSPFVDGGGDNFTVRYNGYLDMRLYAAGDYTIHIQSDDTNYFVMDTVDGTVIADDPNCCAERTQAFTITVPGLFPFDNVFGEQGGGEWTDVAISGPGIPGIVALGDTENGSPPVYVIGGEQLDTDGDGLLDGEEAALGTDPTLVDTDGDSLSDGVEVSGGTSPVLADTDGDGLGDGVETGTGTFVDANDTGTDPLLADTDGDGLSDSAEVAAGSDPNDPLSPEPPSSGHVAERVLYRRTSDIPGNDFGGALPGNVDIEAPFGELDDGSSLVTNINIDREGSVGEGISLAGDNFDLVFVMQFYDADGVFSFTENFDDRVKVVATPIAGSADLTATGASQEHSNTSWNTRTYGNYDFGAGGWFNANIWLTEDGGGAQSAADIGFGYFNGTSTNTADFGGIGYAGTFGVSSGVPAAFDTDDNGESWGAYVVTYDPSIDTDGDSIPDGYEEVYFPGDLTQLGAGDFDDDGVSDVDEYADGTDPTDPDADEDGSNDGQEKAAGTDPANPDSDGDGLLDGVETGTGTFVDANDTGTSPLLADTDSDGLSDGAEIADENYDPNVDDSASDVDADGVSLSEELAAGTDPADDDSDDDTLLDGAELTAGTNPLSNDTDGDGLGDGVETGTGTFVDANDTGTDPLLADTDGDGSDDSYEIDQGFDPNDADSTPPIPVVQPSFIPINEFVPGGYAPDLTQTGLNYQQNKYNGGVIFNNQAEGNYNAHVSGNPTPNSSFDAIVPWASHGNGGGQISDRNSAFVDGGGENFTVRINGYLDMSSFAPGTYNIHLGGDDTNYFIMDTVDGQVTAQHNCCPQNQTTAFTITIPGIFPFDNVFGEQGGGDWYDVGISGPGINGIVALGDTERGSPPVNPIGIATTDSDADGLIDAWELSNTGIDDLTALSSDGDFDSDGSTDLAEYTAGTDPTDDDSDDDGLLDGAEATAGTDPTLADTDGDGLSDGEESTETGTDPLDADTDGDGLADGQELAFGSDPLDAASLPVDPVVQPSFVPINAQESGVYGPDFTTPGVDYQENKYPGGVIANGQSLNNYNVHLSGSPAPNSSVTAVQPWTSHGGGGNFSTRNSPFVDGGGDNFTVRYNGYLDMRGYDAGEYTIHLQSDDTNYFVMDTVDGTVIADDPSCCAERTQAFTISIPGLFPFDNVFGEQGGGEWTDVAISGPGIPGIVALGDTENGSPPVYIIGSGVEAPAERLVNVFFDENGAGNLTLENLTPGETYHVQGSFDGVNFVALAGSEFVTPAADVTVGPLVLPFTTEQQPLLLVKVYEGPIE